MYLVIINRKCQGKTTYNNVGNYFPNWSKLKVKILYKYVIRIIVCNQIKNLLYA